MQLAGRVISDTVDRRLDETHVNQDHGKAIVIREPLAHTTSPDSGFERNTGKYL